VIKAKAGEEVNAATLKAQFEVNDMYVDAVQAKLKVLDAI